MARLYSDENFPFEVVEHLRAQGHDVLTTHDAGKSNQGIEDGAKNSLEACFQCVLLIASNISQK